MSPLLTARPSVSVALRLLAACVVTAVAAAVVPLAGAGASSAAVPAFLAVGCTCAALVGHLLYASCRAMGDGRLAWMSAGVTVAVVGLVTSVLALESLFPAGFVTQSPDAGAARYLIWHGALAAAGALALAGWAPRLRSLLIFGGLGVFLLAWAAVASSPFGELASNDGYSAAMRVSMALTAVAQVAVAAVWWRRAGGAMSWGDMCVLALLGLSALDAVAYLASSEPFAGAWWASLALRAGQFAVPAVGLLIGFIAVADKLRAFGDELTRSLVAEREHARAEEERITLGRGRIQQLIDGDGLGVAFQPIIDLAGGQVVGAEALARFTASDGSALDTERCFHDAHASAFAGDVGAIVVSEGIESESELSCLRGLAVGCGQGFYLARPNLGTIDAEAPRLTPVS